jgi:hypothetical protein
MYVSLTFNDKNEIICFYFYICLGLGFGAVKLGLKFSDEEMSDFATLNYTRGSF